MKTTAGVQENDKTWEGWEEERKNKKNSKQGKQQFVKWYINIVNLIRYLIYIQYSILHINESLEYMDNLRTHLDNEGIC